MKDVRQALSELHSIRQQMAWSTQFRGYGPVSTAFGGVLALAVAILQSVSPVHDDSATGCLGIWIATAALIGALSVVETLSRAKRVHSEFAEQMLVSAAEQFLPALVSALLLTLVLLRIDPRGFWMLPGLWELIFALGVFASCRFLPRLMFAIGVWYLGAGLCTLLICGQTHAFSPWAMGLPFGLGQLAIAGVLRYGFATGPQSDLDS